VIRCAGSLTRGPGGDPERPLDGSEIPAQPLGVAVDRFEGWPIGIERTDAPLGQRVGRAARNEIPCATMQLALVNW
jgi:hypothetical protein